MREMVRRWRRRVAQHPWSFDLGLGLVIAACGVFSTELSRRLAEDSQFEFKAGWGIVTALIIGAAIGLRRRWPLVVLSVVSVVYAIGYVFDATEGIFSAISIFIALYTAGAVGSRPKAHSVRGVNVALMAALIVWSVLDATDLGDEGGGELLSLQLLLVLLNIFYFAAAWVLGDLRYAQRRREAVLEQQAAELIEAHAEIARRAVIDERLRIARELHDVVAHHVSTMGVQAGAARRVLERAPESAAEALANIETSSRQAVAELHSLLGVLRQDGDVDTTAPPPTIACLSDLVTQVEQSGVSVTLTIDGVDDDAVPAGVDLSAYRIVQEALTNVVKHAGPGAVANVAVTLNDRWLTVDVADDGGPHATVAIGNARSTAAAGRGITGMHERVALHGGDLSVGPRPDGGYGIRAVFDLTPAQATS